MPQTALTDYKQLSGFKPLFLDYLHRYEAVSDLFAADPFTAESWSEVARRLEPSAEGRERAAAPLMELNRELGADEHALASLEALGDGALVVITGQQVGLFGGPLYTLYKAVAAVRLAREAESRLGRRVVPLFWMDTDDHDFEEVQETSVLDASHDLHALRYDPAENGRTSVGGRKLTDAIETVLMELDQALPQTEFKDEVVAALSESYAPGRTLAQAFGSWMLRLTRGSGLAVVDPSLPELKSIAAELFAREIEEGSESSRIVERVSADLVARGYHAQASPAESGINLFLADPEREPVRLDGERSQDALAELARTEPERFSPNVLLRPLYQDRVFPTLAYVAGPNELAYFAQLKGVYEHFGQTMPLIASRASFTIVERPQARFVERYGVEMTRLAADDESVLNEILRGQTPPQLEEDLARAKSCIEDITNALQKDLQEIDGSLGPAVKSTRGKLLHQLKDLESKAMRSLKKKNDTVRKQFLSARTALFPGFTLQERTLSALGYLNKYGWHFESIVADAFDPAAKAHVFLEP